MKALIAALTRLYQAPEGQAPGSQFTQAQRKALDRFIQQTQALTCTTSGRGVVYKITQPRVVEQHLHVLSPAISTDLPDALPSRAHNIAHYRNSKTGGHRHSAYYLLMRAQGASVQWRDSANQLNLSDASSRYGVAALEIALGDTWHSEQPLWLVENQALFDRTDWLPEATQAAVHWYRGQLNNTLLDWLAERERVPEVILFPDYDGVGLQNYARLHQRLTGRCSLWLMPDWEAKLGRFGSNEIWQNTRSDFDAAAAYLSQALSLHSQEGRAAQDLLATLRTQGLALEQEAIWL